jgi:hypothetical protein
MKKAQATIEAMRAGLRAEGPLTPALSEAFFSVNRISRIPHHPIRCGTAADQVTELKIYFDISKYRKPVVASLGLLAFNR